MAEDRADLLARLQAVSVKSMCVAQALPSVHAWLENPDALVRGRAAESLGWIADASSIEPLYERMMDPQELYEVGESWES